jgi:hypothetical protein
MCIRSFALFARSSFEIAFPSESFVFHLCQAMYWCAGALGLTCRVDNGCILKENVIAHVLEVARRWT